MACAVRELLDMEARVMRLFRASIIHDPSMTNDDKEQYLAAGPLPVDRYTCSVCPVWRTCNYAFDDYNLDGDCLAEK
jgi:hypothetical protein